MKAKSLIFIVNIDYTFTSFLNYLPAYLLIQKVNKNRELQEGGDLLSQSVARPVPSAQVNLTTVFEMGTGVTSPQEPPSGSSHDMFAR